MIKASMLRGAALLVGLLTLSMNATEFQIDQEHSSVSFKVSHLVVSSVRGQFRKFSGNWDVDPKTLQLQDLKGTVQAQSVDTNDETRDKHLRHGDFFDAEKNNELTIRMVKFTPNGKAGEGTLTAKVNIRGVTRNVDFDVKATKIIPNPMNGGKTVKQGISILGKVDRLDFNIGKKYNSAIIGREVTIHLELEGNGPFLGKHAATSEPDQQ